MDYIANVENSEIDVDQIRTILVQGDATYPHIQFVLDPSLSGLSWRVRGYYRDFNIAVLSDEITPTETETEITVDWYVSTDFTTYYGEMQLVLVGTDALGTTVVKALGNVIIGRDFSISTTQVITQNLFEQLMAQLASTCLKLDQTVPQTLTAPPLLAANRVIDADHQVVDKKFVIDNLPVIPAHNGLASIQGGSAEERYHMTAAQHTVLGNTSGSNSGDQSASSFSHNDLTNKQGGTTNEFYHVTAAEKTVVANTSGTNTGDQVLPTRNSLGLDTDDTVTFANLSGTNTGDQDVSGAISAHNTASTAHSILARKSSTMQLLISRTIGAGENVSAITWTQDDAGNALALIDAEIRINVPANSIAVGVNGYILARINGESSSTSYVQSTALSTAINCTTFRTNFGIGRVRLLKDGSKITGDSAFAYYDGTTVATPTSSVATTFVLSNISSIYLYLLGTGITYFPAGTTIEIYGRTA